MKPTQTEEYDLLYSKSADLNVKHIFKILSQAGGVAQVVECLPNILSQLHLNYLTKQMGAIA
jgi:hypothetical protein